MDRGAWWAIVHGIAKSWTQLSDWHFHFHVFSSSHVQMRVWTIKNVEHWRIRCFRAVTLEKTLKSLLDCKEIKPVNPKENQPWIFIGRTDAKCRLVGKDPDVDWEQVRRGQQRVRWLDNITDSRGMNLSKLREILKDRDAWHAAVQRVRQSLVTEQQQLV